MNAMIPQSPPCQPPQARLDGQNDPDSTMEEEIFCEPSNKSDLDTHQMDTDESSNDESGYESEDTNSTPNLNDTSFDQDDFESQSGDDSASDTSLACEKFPREMQNHPQVHWDGQVILESPWYPFPSKEVSFSSIRTNCNTCPAA